MLFELDKIHKPAMRKAIAAISTPPIGAMVVWGDITRLNRLMAAENPPKYMPTANPPLAGGNRDRARGTVPFQTKLKQASRAIATRVTAIAP